MRFLALKFDKKPSAAKQHLQIMKPTEANYCNKVLKNFIIKLNAKKVLKLILKTLKKADDVSALPYAIIKSKKVIVKTRIDKT